MIPGSRIVYIDMDDTLFDYMGAHQKALRERPAQPFPQSQLGFFLNLEPLAGAVAAYSDLAGMGYKPMFLTAPSVYNPLSYMEKRACIEKHFGFDACYNLILAYDKSLLKGYALVDDKENSNKQNEFDGKFIHFGSEKFPNWEVTLRWFREMADIL